MRRIWAAIGMFVILSPLPACSSSGNASGKPSAKPPAMYDLPPRPVRDGERPVKTATARSGMLAFNVIGLTDRLPEVVGSHAEWPAKGQFVRVRVLIENIDRTTATFDTTKALLVTTDGRTYHRNRDAMQIKRQPADIDLGASMRVELDLWFDIPRDSREAAVRLFGTAPVGFTEAPPADVKLS